MCCKEDKIAETELCEIYDHLTVFISRTIGCGYTPSVVIPQVWLYPHLPLFVLLSV